MEKEEVSTPIANAESVSNQEVHQEAEIEAFDADESSSSNDSSTGNGESLARRLQEFTEESRNNFKHLFLQIKSVSENLTNAIREISLEIERRAAITNAENAAEIIE